MRLSGKPAVSRSASSPRPRSHRLGICVSSWIICCASLPARPFQSLDIVGSPSAERSSWARPPPPTPTPPRPHPQPLPQPHPQPHPQPPSSATTASPADISCRRLLPASPRSRAAKFASSFPRQHAPRMAAWVRWKTHLELNLAWHACTSN